MTEARFEILAHRSASSVLGADTRPLKMDGELFPPLTRYYAQMIVDALNAKTGSANVHYTMREFS